MSPPASGNHARARVLFQKGTKRSGGVRRGERWGSGMRREGGDKEYEGKEQGVEIRPPGSTAHNNSPPTRYPPPSA